MEQIVSHHEWTRSMPYPTDKVIVRNLFTQAKAGTDVWGRKQQQPALISITLHLSKPFDSAAQRDTVDQSTVHYGILSKAVKSTIENPEEDWRSTAELASVIEAVIWKCAPTTDLIAAFEIEISYPKGSILGDGVSYLYCKSFPDGQSTRGLESRVLHLKNMRLPCMIGANDHERFRKQAIVANLWVDALGNLDSGDSYTNAEDILVKVTNDLDPIDKCTTLSQTRSSSRLLSLR